MRTIFPLTGFSIAFLSLKQLSLTLFIRAGIVRRIIRVALVARSWDWLTETLGLIREAILFTGYS